MFFNLMYDIVCRVLRQRGLLLVGSRCRFCNIYKLRCNLAKKDCKPFEVNSLHCSLLFSVNDSLSFLLFLSLLFLIELSWKPDILASLAVIVACCCLLWRSSSARVSNDMPYAGQLIVPVVSDIIVVITLWYLQGAGIFLPARLPRHHQHSMLLYYAFPSALLFSLPTVAP